HVQGADDAFVGRAVRLVGRGHRRARADRLWLTRGRRRPAILNIGRGKAMNAVDLGVNLFVTLFALLDPIGNLPIFAAATAGATLRQRVSVSGLICLFAAVFLAFFLF